MQNSNAPTRRGALCSAGALAAASLIGFRAQSATANEKPSVEGFRYGLNMSTIRGQDLPADQEIETAGKAGYDAVEPWMRKLHQFVESGGSLQDLKKRLDDHGLTVESAIGFAPWVVNDEARRAAGLEEAKRDMDIIAKLGGKLIAAPPAGVPRGEKISLMDAGKRYRALLEIGVKMGVTPQVEMWGGNPTIGRMSAAIFIAIESGHPDACFLGDVYHIYKGGSDFDAIKLLSGRSMRVFHFNDYPADPPRETIGDKDRVYPGDGVAPMKEIFANFAAVNAKPVLSLELFNRSYWEKDALETARTGLAKMKEAVAKATT